MTHDLATGKLNRLEFEVSSRLKALDDGSVGSNAIELTLELLRKYEELSASVYRLRSSDHLSDEDRAKIEDSFTHISQELLRRRVLPRRSKESFAQKYRRIWRRDFTLFVVCAAIFCISTLVGAIFGSTRPEYAAVFMPSELIESILDNKPWFYLDEVESGPEVALSLAFHNIMVCIKLFVYGAILGIGGLMLLSYNGLFFGAVFGYCYVNGFHRQLRDFVLGHGFLELSIVVVAAFASLQYGRAFVTRPYSGFLKRLTVGVRDGATIMLGSVPWLIVAGAIEGIISTATVLPASVRLTLGLAAAALFWIWTFWGLGGLKRQLSVVPADKSILTETPKIGATYSANAVMTRKP